MKRNFFYVTKLLVLVEVFSLIILGCQLNATENSVIFNVSDRIGWLHGNCLAIKDSGLKKGTKLTVIKLGKPQSVSEAKILRPVQSGDQCHALLEGRKTVNLSEGNSFYLVTSLDKDDLGLAIGIINPKTTISSTNGMVHTDVNGDGVEDYFTQCSTSEGMSFSIWSKSPYKGEPLWSAYYYLDYDVEANCP